MLLRKVAPLALVLPIALFALGERASDGAPVAQPAKPALNDWFALGSGCRARSSEAGDVTMERLPADPARPDVVRARFHLGAMKLASADRAAGAPLKFARECSIRLNVNPPPGMKVTHVAARTSLATTKTAGVSITEQTELLLGRAVLGRRLESHAAGEMVSGRVQDVSLAPGGAGSEPFPALTCAEPKIIGFNLTWIAERASADDAVEVTLGGARTVEIEAELGACAEGGS